MNFNTRIAGVSFYQDAVTKVKNGDPVTLIREPFNVHDKNAIRVCVGEETIGYIPRDYAEELAVDMDAGRSITGSVISAKRPHSKAPIGVLVELIYDASQERVFEEDNS